MLEPIEKQYMQIGYVARSHGVNGEVVILSEGFAPQLFEDIDLVHIQNARGDLIPARMESVRVQQKDSRLLFFVKFEHVKDRNQAEELKSCPVHVRRDKAEHLIEDNDATADYDYTSYKVHDENDECIGEVTGMLDSPAHPILEVVTEDGKQLLVPFVDEYIRSSDKETNIIKCQNLNQLTDET